MNYKHCIIFLNTILMLFSCRSNPAQEFLVQTGAEQPELYLPLMKNKTVGVVANPTSVIQSVHLVDMLLDADIRISRIYSPEHGFRGTAGAGEAVNHTQDIKTGIRIVSLYGSATKPTPDDLQGIDIMIYDLQDIGVRFYTYISTLHYIMEACAERGISLIVLDRPNPNGHYVDGPVLKSEFRSFVGMHPIPVVHGMTTGELALMFNGEGWLSEGIQCDLEVIPCKGYTHQSRYVLPVHPSPNITSMEAVYLYPSLCLFEGTVMNVGRGTDFPFRLYGHPDYPDPSFSYMPVSNAGNVNPLHNGQKCFGVDLTGLPADSLFSMRRINLTWIKEAYTLMGRDSDFFNSYFNTLAGNDRLKDQIIEGMTEEEIRNSWQADLDQFMQIRAKYLLYE